MKKLTCILGALVLVFALGSCNSKTDYSLDKTALNTLAATEWLNNITYSETAFNTFEEDSSAHYEMFLPTDLTAACKLNIMNVEESIDKRTDYFEIKSGSATEFNDTAISTIEDIVYSDLKVETLAGLTFTASVPENFSIEVDFDSEKLPEVEGKDRVLYVVYLPIYTEYYLQDSDDVNHNTIQTYIIIPVAYGLGYLNGTTYEGIDASVMAIPQITDLNTKLTKSE